MPAAACLRTTSEKHAALRDPRVNKRRPGQVKRMGWSLTVLAAVMVGFMQGVNAQTMSPTAALAVQASPMHKYPRPRASPRRPRKAFAVRADSRRLPRPPKRPASIPREELPTIASSSIYDASSDTSLLKPLRTNLMRLCNGESSVPVDVLHLGDSHTAGDVFTGYLRDRFQAEFGAGGRGMLPAGVPFKYYRPRQLKVSRKQSWKHQNSVRRKASGPFGITGFRAIGNKANQRLVLVSRTPDPFEMFKVEVRTRKDGGALKVMIGDAPAVMLSTRTTTYPHRSNGEFAHWTEPLRTRNGRSLPYVEHTFSVPRGARKVEVWPAGDGPVELLSWSLRGGRPGVLYHSQGVVGASAEIVKRWDRELVQAELSRLQPGLVLLAYGTNEGFNDRLDLSKYRHSVRRTLRTLREAAPYAAFAIAAPPDAARMPKHCPRSARKTASCRPLSRSEKLNYQKLIRAKSPDLCRWHAPPNLSRVRGVMAELANDEGYFYWDWSEVMGASCGIEGWVKRKPKLAHGDRVHLTNRGYKRSADFLYKALRGDARCQRAAILSAN